jgi:DNA repair protein RecO (recombination protein O)
MGYAPHLSGCCRCGTKQIDQIYFTFDDCGFVCEQCRKQNENIVHIEPGTAKALVYVICAGVREAFGFELSEEPLRNFSKIVDKYIGDRLEKKYSKLSILKDIK